MEELISPLRGISPMWAIVCIETIIVVIAMSIDFASGFYKAKLRGEVRNSVGLKRTISKFILYVGSILIAACVDSMFYMCGFWEIIRFSALTKVPVIGTLLSVFICTVEIRSIWEKAEQKQQRDAMLTVEALVQLLGKDTVGEKLESVINKLKDKD
jgi:phage-related holin